MATQKRVAFVDDSSDFFRTRVQVLHLDFPTVEFTHFITGNRLLELLKQNQRFDAYLVDLVPLGGALNGIECTEEIIKLHPDAVIIGMSAVSTSDQVRADWIKQRFVSAGAKEFVNKAAGVDAMADALRRLLK